MNIFPINQTEIQIFQGSPETMVSEASKDIIKRLKKISTGYFYQSDNILLNKLKEVEAVELTKLLKCFFIEMIQENCLSDPIKLLDRLANVVSLEKLQEAVKDNVEDAFEEAKGMFEEAKLYVQMTNESTSPSIRVLMSSILEGIISVLESIIAAFGIGDFFKPAESDIHADFKSQKIMMLLSLFSMITTMIIPILGATSGGLIIGGILLSIAALSAIWPFIKPRTTHLPANAENWTKQVQQGGFVAQGRKESLNQIANIIKMNRHAILVGPSRVGKSLTAKAFAQAIERGDYPELKGKVVFRINTSEIVGQQASFLGGGNNILNKISAAMGRHRKDIILVLDEIHMACKNNEKIADQLKTFLDEKGEFPHVIGITTEKEYNEHVKNNEAFSLRFDRVDIQNTSQDETLRILAETILTSPSKPLIKGKMLNYIYEKSCKVQDAPQPAASLKLLKLCMNQTGKTQQLPIEKKMIEISNKILSTRLQALVNHGINKQTKMEIAELEKQLIQLKTHLSEKQKRLDQLFQAKNLLDRVRKETYSSILKISTIANHTLYPKNEKQVKIFLLLREFLGRSLESYIQETTKILGIKAEIDKDLIDQMAAV